MIINIFPLTTLVIVALGQDILLDENTECNDSGGKFANMKDVEIDCKPHRGWKKIWRCKLKCLNGIKTIREKIAFKCKAKNHPDQKYGYDASKPTTYKWQPNAMRNADSICKPRQECEDINEHYNISDELITLKNTSLWYYGRKFRYDFRSVIIDMMKVNFGNDKILHIFYYRENSK